MKRREFLAMGAAALPLASLAPRSLPFRSKLGRIGIQLYTVRRELARDVEGTLARLAAIGYREVEFAGYPQGTGSSLRSILDRNGLVAPSSHVQLQAMRSDWDRALEEAAAVGQRYVTLAYINAPERRTADDWKRLAALFNRCGEAAKRRGLEFGYHNHDYEFAPIEGTIGYDILLSETDPKLVRFQMDLYWITKGGRDPLSYFERWPGRFPMFHVKDMDASPAKGFADLGRGTIDFPNIFKHAKRAGVRHYFYEQDSTPGPVFDSAKVGYDYLRNLKY